MWQHKPGFDRHSLVSPLVTYSHGLVLMIRCPLSFICCCSPSDSTNGLHITRTLRAGLVAYSSRVLLLHSCIPRRATANWIILRCRTLLRKLSVKIHGAGLVLKSWKSKDQTSNSKLGLSAQSACFTSWVTVAWLCLQSWAVYLYVEVVQWSNHWTCALYILKHKQRYTLRIAREEI